MKKIILWNTIAIFLFSNIQFDLFSQPFIFSEGLYRVPYENGQAITMLSDVWSHAPLGKYDMKASSANKKIVAAADGWVRGIQESFNVACNGDVPCCFEFNNYVVLEHPNGEWSGYTHIQLNSATQQGISIDQWVTVGTPLGLEGNVGCSTDRHLHFEVSRPSDPENGFQVTGGFLNGENLIPVICGIPFSYFIDGGLYLSNPCGDDCATLQTFSQSLSNGDYRVIRADQTIQNSLNSDVNYASGSVAQFRSGQTILLRPGFEAKTGCHLFAQIKTCNEQE